MAAVETGGGEPMKEVEGGDDFRKEIQNIQRDATKSAAEKQKLVQALLMKKAATMKSETQDEEMKEEQDDSINNQQQHRRPNAKETTPLFQGRNVSFDVRILNDRFSCSLCGGYFREASTIKECLHTFCKSCIFNHFIYYKDCPRCRVSLGPQPWSRVKYDRQLQGLVDKLYAEVVQTDLEAERDFWENQGVKFNIRKKEESSGLEVKQLSRDEALRQRYTDEVELIVSPDLTAARTDQLHALQNEWVKTTAKITISALKRYLIQKLKIRLDPEDIELTYRGVPVANEHSLEYIIRLYGAPPRDEYPEIRYKRKRFAQ